MQLLSAKDTKKEKEDEPTRDSDGIDAGVNPKRTSGASNDEDNKHEDEEGHSGTKDETNADDDGEKEDDDEDKPVRRVRTKSERSEVNKENEDGLGMSDLRRRISIGSFCLRFIC